MPKALLALVSRTAALDTELNLEFVPMIEQVQTAMRCVTDAYFGVWR